MTDKSKDSRNTPNILADAIGCLQRQEGIIIEQNGGKKIALYPAEFLHDNELKKYPLANSKLFIMLAKRAGLLPVLAIIPESKITANWPIFPEEILERSLEQSGGKIFETARAKLPLDGAEDAVLVSFREQDDEKVHLALIIGKASAKELPLLRVHSSCITGDLLGSLRCDCGDQLKLSLEAIKASGYGILLYLNQEGRGIGITNKLRAYGLQEQGMDTYQANHALGFESDERDFTTASSILKSLNITEIKLLSNNPYKVTELEKHGIKVVERVPLIVPVGKYNRDYLAAKQQKAGHVLGDNVGEND